jgi:hypothetical protein
MDTATDNNDNQIVMDLFNEALVLEHKIDRYRAEIASLEGERELLFKLVYQIKGKGFRVRFNGKVGVIVQRASQYFFRVESKKEVLDIA